MDSDKFRCPICNNVFSLDEGILEKVKVDSKHVGTTWRSRSFTKHYVETWCNVRYCKSCHKKRKGCWFSSCFTILALWIISFIVLMIKSPNPSFWDGFGAFIGLGFLFALVGSFINWILEQHFDRSFDIEKAYEDNAIEPIYDK